MSESNSCSTQNQCAWSKFGCLTAEQWAFLVLRLFLGLRFLLAGINKFNSSQGFSFNNYYDNFVRNQLEFFVNNTFLPKFAVWPYLHTLAYVEILLGVALLLGIRTKCALVLTSLTYVSLAFGLMLMPPSQVSSGIADIGIHLGLCVGALLLVKHNRFALCKAC